jgi:plastocyanin
MKRATPLATTLFAVTLLLAGCGGSSSGETPPPAAATTDAPAAEPPADADADADAGVVVDVEIKDGQVTPQGERVEARVGQPITLTITSDVDEEIHVHSDPDHTWQVAAGESITESFTVDTPGQVAVEGHDLGVTIVQLVVRP